MNRLSNGCGQSDSTAIGHETVQIPRSGSVCILCEEYADVQATKPMVVMSCEGACLRGEIARRAANILCHRIDPEHTARLCLGGAFTKNTGQRALAREAKRLVSLEGCPIKCATRMMQGVLNGREAEAVVTDCLFEFDAKLFGIDEMSEEEISANALVVAEKVAEMLGSGAGTTQRATQCAKSAC